MLHNNFIFKPTASQFSKLLMISSELSNNNEKVPFFINFFWGTKTKGVYYRSLYGMRQNT